MPDVNSIDDGKVMEPSQRSNRTWNGYERYVKSRGKYYVFLFEKSGKGPVGRGEARDISDAHRKAVADAN